tara:strand:- start:95 stop:385 length:291 start_codon:yes stop_codon:yes gene_type:complete
MKKLTLLLCSIILISCSDSQDGEPIDGVVLSVYPDRNNLLDDETYEGLSSLEECREKANMIIIENDYKNSDYECGTQCIKKNDYGDSIYICKSTER